MRKAAFCTSTWHLNSATAEKAATYCGALAAAMPVACSALPPSLLQDRLQEESQQNQDRLQDVEAQQQEVCVQ